MVSAYILVAGLAVVAVVMLVLSRRRPNVERLETQGNIRGLIRTLGHRDRIVREHATQALIRIGAPAVKPLSEVLRHKLASIYQAAIQALAGIGTSAVEPLYRSAQGR